MCQGFLILNIFLINFTCFLHRAQDKVQKLTEEEEIARVKEEERLIEEIKKKGGKAPPAKPKAKDPKKAAQELEVRQKELMDKVGIEPLEFCDTPMGSKFILIMNMKEFSEKMYVVENEEEKKELKEEKKEEEKKEDGMKNGEIKGKEEKKEVDYKAASPIDSQNVPILDTNVVFSCENIKKLLEIVRGKVFEFLNQWKNKSLNENSSMDKEFVRSQ